MNTNIFSDPAIVGPGMWASLHIDAVHAVTDDLKRAFVINTNAKCDNFKCAKCKPHFRSFINSNPFEKYWNIKNNDGKDIGFFKWTWELHNQVNKRLNKTITTFDEAYAYWSNKNEGVCTKCAENAAKKATYINKAMGLTVPTSQYTPVSNHNQHIPHILSMYIENANSVQTKPLV